MRRLSGRLRSALLIGLQGIRSRKTRTLLSTISLFLGVLAVVVVQAGYETASRSMLNDIEITNGVDGTLTMGVWGDSRALQAALNAMEGRTDAVATASMDAIIGEPNVRPVNEGGSPFDQDWGGWAPVEVRCDPTGYCYQVVDEQYQQAPKGAAIQLRLVGLTGDVRQFKPFRPVAGDWLDFDSAPSYSPTLVINREAAKGFGMDRVPAEMRITGAAENATPRIIGVVDDGQQQPTAYVRMDELLNWVSLSPDADDPQSRYGGGLNLEVFAAPTATDTVRILRANLTGAGVPADAMYVSTIESRKEIERTLGLLRWLFLGVAALVLFIGVAGILNVGLATVGERVEEFALRRAVGTPRLLLAGIVLAETMITGLLTAAAATGVAAVGLRVAGPILGREAVSLQNMVFPWQAAMAGVVAGLVAGVLGGLVPAIRAARIPIATVMRA